MSAFSDLVAFDRNYLFDLDATSEVDLQNFNSASFALSAEEVGHQTHPSID